MLLGMKITLLVLSIIIVGLLFAVEKAIYSCNSNMMKNMAEEGNIRAKRVVKIDEKPGRLFATSVMLGIFTGFLSVSLLLNPLINLVRDQVEFQYMEEVTALALAVVLSTLYLIFALLFPRQIAIRHTTKVALSLSGYATFILTLCSPFMAVCTGATKVFLKVTGQKIRFKDESYSEEDIMSMLEVGKETGVLKEEGKKMIDSIFDFDDKLAYEIMTPRTDVFSIDIEDETEDYIDQLMEMRYSRIPVYEEDSDNIIGILNIKDFLIKAREKGFDGVVVKDILREPFFVPETKNIDSLFFELQRQKQHIAILIDEYGGFSGIVTMEDLIEQVMGDIDDEYDDEEPSIEHISPTTFLIDGNMDLDDINEEIQTDFQSENSETLGGFLIEILGEIPDQEEDENPVVMYENYKFTIETVLDRRIIKVRLEILDEEEDHQSKKTEGDS